MILFMRRFIVSRYTIYSGKFKCQKCNADVNSSRFYPENKDITWMCNSKHLSKVNLAQEKKTKKDYERKI